MQPPAHSVGTDGRPGVLDALTELHAYRLALDGELERVENRIAELDRSGRDPDDAGDLPRRCTEIAAQLELLSRTIVALRSAADPDGRYL